MRRQYAQQAGPTTSVGPECANAQTLDDPPTDIQWCEQMGKTLRGGHASPALANMVSGSNSEMAFATAAYCACAGLAPSRHR